MYSTYVGILIKDAPEERRKGEEKEMRDDKENRPDADAVKRVLAEKDRLLAEKDAEIEALRAQLARLQTSGRSLPSSDYSVSSFARLWNRCGKKNVCMLCWVQRTAPCSTNRWQSDHGLSRLNDADAVQL